MVQRNETDWKQLDWSHYESHFPGLTSAKLYVLMRQLVVAFVPKAKWTNLKSKVNFRYKESQSKLL